MYVTVVQWAELEFLSWVDSHVYRVQLKSTENLAEKLVGHVKDSIDEREAKLRREYEEKLRK